MTENDRIREQAAGQDQFVQQLARAVALHLNGQSAEALTAMEGAQASGGDMAEMLAARGQLQMELGNFSDAARSLSQFQQLAPDKWAGTYHLGLCLQNQGLWREAVEFFRRASSIDPNRPEARIAAGTCLLQQDMPQQALDEFEACLKNWPDNEQANFGKATSLHMMGMLDAAAERYAAILERTPDSEGAITNMIAVRIQKMDWPQVRIFARRLLEIKPNSETALEALGTSSFAEQDFRAAVEYYKKLAGLRPRNFEYWFNLGVTLQSAEKPDEAALAYERCKKIQPDAVGPLINLGLVYEQMGDTKKAADAFMAALRLEPNREELGFHLAILTERAGQLQEAEALYAAFGEKTGNNAAAAQFRAGCIRLARQDYPGAAKAFRTCLDKRSPWAEASVRLGYALWKLGAVDDAEAELTKVAADHPDSIDAVRGLAAIAIAKQDWARAHQLHSKLIAAGEQKPHVLYNLAALAQQAGNTDESVACYRRVLELDPNFAEALLNLGAILKAAGKEEESRQYLERALRVKPELARGYFMANE